MSLPNEFDQHPTFRLGWQGPTQKRVLAMSNYFAAPDVITVAPPTADFMSEVGTWCGETNKRFGTCGPNMVANLMTMTFAYALDEQVTISDDAIYDLYRRSGNPSFNPATGQDDNGVDNAVLFGACLAGGASDAGIDITRSNGSVERHTVAAYGKLTGQGPSLVQQLRIATALFGGACISVMLQIAQQHQTVASPPIWADVPSSPDWGGHDIFGGRYTGEEGADEHVISWLVDVGVADGYIRARAQELFVAIPTIALKYKPVADNVDWAALSSDFRLITGRTINLSGL